MKLKYLDYNLAYALIQEGDILLFRGQGLVAWTIKKASRGKYSHVALASWRGEQHNSLLECVEFREWKGGRTVSLKHQVLMNNGLIDVYRICPEHIQIKTKWTENGLEVIENKLFFDGRLATEEMRVMTGLPYGWKRILWLATFYLPWIRLLQSADTNDERENVYPVCSTALVAAVRKHYLDLVPNKSDRSTEPSDIARSSCVNYLFTLKIG